MNPSSSSVKNESHARDHKTHKADVRDRPKHSSKALCAVVVSIS